jgi:tetrahedral aminopeptidase
MQTESKNFLFKLLSTPSPTGYEQRIQRVVSKHMQPYADLIESDLHGNLIIAVNTKAKRKLMLAGHCDQIGFMVKHLSDDGFIYVAALGGVDAGVLYGAAVTIHAKGGPIAGVIGRKPIHLQKGDERTKIESDLEKIWIDVGAASKKELQKLIEVGDPVTFEMGVTELMNGHIVSPGMDDRVGLFVAMETLRLCARGKLEVGLYAVSTVQEEVGLRGATTAAFGIAPEVGIAIDVAHASDNPGNEGKQQIPCKLGAGPVIYRGPNVNPVVEKRLVAAAKKAKLPYQLSPSAVLLGTDARAIQVTRAGVATGGIGIPNRYMHTQVEQCHLKDIENTTRLLAEFVKGIAAKTSFKMI